jgi:ornithine--oxo-acid transaminase
MRQQDERVARSKCPEDKQMPEAQRAADPEMLYERYVNPQWVRLLDVLRMNVDYVRCVGAELHTANGRRILDFISGYCVHNIGHNHPRVISALKYELDRNGPAMLQSHVSELAGELAARLCDRAGGRLTRAFFCSSASEGIETVIKFTRAHTGRPGILYAAGGFHGLTCGALSLMANPFWKEGFGPLLPDTEAVPFGDLDGLARKLASRRFAAFVVEPVQAESGVLVPPCEYLQGAQALCRRYGALFVLDEVQTGMYRTGPFLAAHHFDVDPDMVVMAKALSGGLVPCAAVLMSSTISDSIYSSLKRAVIHTSTYSENSLAMRAGLATLDVLEQERLGQRAATAGAALRERLTARLSSYEMVGEIRGLGLLNAIEFKAPRPSAPEDSVRGLRQDPSRDVRPGFGDEAFRRSGNTQSNLWQQLHGAQGRSSIGYRGRAARSIHRWSRQGSGFDAYLRVFLVRSA